MRRAAAALVVGGACAVLAVLVGPAPAAEAATVPCSTPGDLYASSGTMTTLPGVASVKVWGYRTTSGTVTQPGGPTLCAHVGDTVTITLHNQLTEATALLFQGQDVVPDLTGAPAGGDKTYSFVASRPGTYLYEAGLLPNAQHQVAMGLYGALIIRPAVDTQAYDGSTTFDDEAVLVLSEIDTALNNRVAGPAGFDMRKYSPRYFLINGKVHPNTDPISTGAGRTVLLRYVNAGNQYHSVGILGAHQTVVALDGSLLTVTPPGQSAVPVGRRYVAETFGPGQTADALVVAPAATADRRVAVYDASLLLHNSNLAGAGGMVTYLSVTGSGGGSDTTGPVASNVSFAAGTLSAALDETTTGGANITAASYFVDSLAGAGTPMTGTFGSVSASVSATVTVPSGQHILYVRGQDSLGNWGVLSSVLVNGGDTTGPATRSATLTPSRTKDPVGVDVALHATGDDTATGGSNVVAAEYTIDGGAAFPMTVNAVAPVVSLDAAIPAATVDALTEGIHAVSVRSQDAGGAWGDPTSVTLFIDETVPVTGTVTAAPNPNNGTLAINVGTPAVRVSTTVSDPLSGGVQSSVVAAEGFLCTTPAVGCAVGADGTGFVLAASDGAFNSPSEAAYADIPLATVLQLSNGNHTIYVHAKDAAGNWGVVSSTTLLIDKVAPTIVSIARLDPNPTTAASVQFLVTFSEPVTGVSSGSFALANGAGTSGTAITSVTGTGATRTVTVATGLGGGGTVGLNLSSATGISDPAGNALPTTGLPFVGQTYTQPTPSLYFSTAGNSNPPGVAGTADDADTYLWNGSAFSRSVDVTAIANPLPAGANVDGLDRISATQFYLSFNGNVAVPGIGTVADEDVVLYNAGTWSLFFDGSVNGVGATDLDAISVVAGQLYFSTDSTTVPPGVGGTGDDADIYRWNGASSYTRVVDASAVGWSTANVDGLVWVDATHVYLSYSADTNVPGFGGVQDEDVVYRNGTTWSVFFNGTARGLTSANLDVDAFDLP